MQVNKQLRFVITIGCILFSTALKAQGYPPVKDTLSGAAFSRMVEQSLSSYYAELASNGSTDSIIDALAYEAGSIPEFTDDDYCKRLAKMNEVSNFGFDCNNVSLTTIKFFAENRRNFAKVVLGRSKLYFDLYEEKLAEYDLPLELKYLSVIESGLRPQVKSRAGALGLWQFMYATGAYLLTYHAEHNILPAESKIHYYQLDTMCLNSGIHMQTIDKLVGWTPEDIQALNPVYKTTYIPPTYPQQCITGPLEKIGLLVSLEDSLYITERRLYGVGNTVPRVTPPVNNNPDQIVISNPNPVKEIPKTQVVTTINYTYHRVKTGESLGKIASQYNASIQEVMDWNQLASTRINVGQMLKIQTKVTTTIENPEYLQQQQDSLKINESDTIQQTIQPPVNTPPKPQPKPEVRKKFYAVRSGDTFSAIAGRHGLTVTQLKKLNPGVNTSRISVGQKIRIK
ncbi:MAG: LysM peptidoglycan-binding domain-containing protein [Flavobacteriia bacterium]|nr:LysM peptidoglycan-binding domain-containing protein [Flavobacteriia bacterium]